MRRSSSRTRAPIYRLDTAGIERVAYDQTEQVNLTRDFLNDRERYVKRLLTPPSE
jgi:predicted ATPase